MSTSATPADKDLLEEYDSFQSNNQYWLDDYCLYMAGKDYHNGSALVRVGGQSLRSDSEGTDCLG